MQGVLGQLAQCGAIDGKVVTPCGIPQRSTAFCLNRMCQIPSGKTFCHGFISSPLARVWRP